MTPQPPRRRGRRHHWRKVWKQHPERMRQNLEVLVGVKRDLAIQRQTRLMAIVALMPVGPMPSFGLRDELAEAWSQVFGEELTTRQAWNEVRFGIRRGVFVLRQDGMYDTMGVNGERAQGGLGEASQE